MAHIPYIRQSMPDRDTSKNVRRLMLEESFTKLVAAFHLDKSGDKAYRVGERLVIREKALLRLGELLSRLASCLRSLT